MRLFNQLLAEQSIATAQTGKEPAFTGRYLVLLDEDAGDDGVEAVAASGNLRVKSATVEGREIRSAQIEDADAVVFPALGVALVDAAPDQVRGLAAATAQESPILAMEPERILRALEAPALDLTVGGDVAEASPEYRRGYRDAIFDMIGGEAAPSTIRLPGTEATTTMTWGLQAIGVDESTPTAEGIRVAVLDTGFYGGHPDFGDRTIHGESFISGETVDDVNGHGTHCVGTSCGPKTSQRGTRYGVASDAEIYVGKVLNNQGRGSEGGILAGVDWAVRNRCHIVSMSLGGPVLPNQPHSGVFERAARRALRRGTLIIAAAGNDSRRPSSTSPVSYPANCPSIIAVGAINSARRVASFSNQGINPQGGEVDLVGPGVGVLSSWPSPRLYNTISGTSMATPHVAGAAAVICGETGERGRDLWDRLIDLCTPIPLPSADVGAGLVQVP